MKSLVKRMALQNKELRLKWFLNQNQRELKVSLMANSSLSFLLNCTSLFYETVYLSSQHFTFEWRFIVSFDCLTEKGYV